METRLKHLEDTLREGGVESDEEFHYHYQTGFFKGLAKAYPQFNLKVFTGREARELFRFSKEEIHDMVRHLGIAEATEYLKTRNHSCAPTEALCILLNRLSSNTRRCYSLLVFPNRSKSSLSSISNGLAKFLNKKFAKKIALDEGMLTQENLKNWATSIESKSKSKLPYDNIAMFLDESTLTTRGPNQSLINTSFKTEHGLKYQSMVSPSGYLVSNSKLVSLAVNDLQLSQNNEYTNNRLLELLKIDNSQNYFKIYGDKAYSCPDSASPYLRASKHEILDFEQDEGDDEAADQSENSESLDSNEDLSEEESNSESHGNELHWNVKRENRIEWSFDLLHTQFPTIFDGRLILGVENTNNMLNCAILFVNLQNCFHKNHIASHFGMETYNIEQYLNL